MSDPLDESVLESLAKWELPTGMLTDESYTDVYEYIDDIEEVAELLIDEVDSFTNKREKYKDTHRDVIIERAKKTRDLCRFARKAFYKLEAGDLRYTVGVAKIFSRLGESVDALSLAAGPLSDENDDEITFFELALIGNDADRQRAASLSRAVSARVNTPWRDLATEIWSRHPTWTHNRVAAEVSSRMSADHRSVMRAIKPLIPASSPSFKG